MLHGECCPRCSEPLQLDMRVQRAGGGGERLQRAEIVLPGDGPRRFFDAPILDSGVPARETASRDGSSSGSWPRISGEMHEAVGLDDDVVARLKFDPEVQTVRRQLLIGTLVVVVLIVLAVLWNSTGGSLMFDGQDVDRAVQSRVKSASEADNAVGLIRAGESDPSHGKLPPSIAFEGAQNEEEGDPALKTAPPEPIRIVVPGKVNPP